MLKNKHPDPIASSIRIELSQGFGWERGNVQVYGPGTLFQGMYVVLITKTSDSLFNNNNKGHVILRTNAHSRKATTLRLLFQATEAMLNHDLGPGVQRSHTSKLFGVATNLWEKGQDNELQPMATYKFLFTIQMPMVQFPPSVEHQYYRCSYKLTAYLDPSLAYKEVPVMAHTCVNYIPLIETKLLKSPLTLTDVKRRMILQDLRLNISASVKLYAVEYVAGDMIQATIRVTDMHRNKNKNRSLTLNDLSVTMSVFQISKFNSDDKPILNKLVATRTHILKNNRQRVDNTQDDTSQIHQVQLELDESLPPSMEFSEIMSLSYKLVISVHKTIVTTKKNNKKLLNVKNLLLPWTNDLHIFEQPIIIGTMGRGIRMGDELDVYSKYKRTDNPIPHPKFLQTVEYEDALPLYDPSRLPSYHNLSRSNSSI